MLDTAAAGSNLADSRRVPGKTEASGGNAGLVITPDASLTLGLAPGNGHGHGIGEVSVATGKTARILARDIAREVYWTNPTGTKLIIVAQRGGRLELGIATADGGFTPLPAPKPVTASHWQDLFAAF